MRDTGELSREGRVGHPPGQTSTCYDADFYPYGGEIAHTNTCTQNYKFTSKERDIESGLDYFGARHYASTLGRYLSPDPLNASAHVADPQSWNRYAYVLNNPLRYVDPTGMDPGCGTGNDSKCQVTIRVNVIYDQNANNGKGLTDKQKAEFQKGILAKAQKDFGKSGIGLQVTYTAGSLSQSDDGKWHVQGMQSNSLNLLVSSALPTGNSGESSFKGGFYLSMVGVDDAHSHNAFPLFTNDVEHEFTHQLKGDTQNPNTNPFSYEANEFNVDFRVTMMGWGVQQSSLVAGAKDKPFTVQPEQKNLQPRTDH
jgi:RHS repeat-associated protein